MYKDKNKSEQIIKQSEEYIANHPEVSKMSSDELSEYFASVE